MTSLYILNINHAADTWLANMFSHSFGCLFNRLNVFFAVQKLFSFMESHVFTFVLVACAFDVLFKKSLPRPRSRLFFPVFSSRSLIYF